MPKDFAFPAATDELSGAEPVGCFGPGLQHRLPGRAVGRLAPGVNVMAAEREVSATLAASVRGDNRLRSEAPR